MKVIVTNLDKLENATEYKVWTDNGCEEYFATLASALEYFNNHDGEKTLEAMLLIFECQKKGTKE